MRTCNYLKQRPKHSTECLFLEFWKTPRKALVVEDYFSKVQVFIPQFVQLGLQHELFFLKMLQKFQKSQFFVVSLCSSFWIYIRLSQLILPTIPLVYEKLGDVSGEIVNLGFFVVVERDGPVLKYGFVGRVDSKSIRMATNLFLLVHLTYYIRQSFIQYTACN